MFLTVQHNSVNSKIPLRLIYTGTMEHPVIFIQGAPELEIVTSTASNEEPSRINQRD